MAYPLVAGLAGWIMERGARSFARAAVAGIAGGDCAVCRRNWLAAILLTLSLWPCASDFYWFVFAEVIKVMLAAAIARGWQRIDKTYIVIRSTIGCGH